jgi:recombination protein RecT
MAQTRQLDRRNRQGNQHPDKREEKPALTPEQIQELSRELMAGLGSMQRAIEYVLPNDMTFDAFRTIILIAIRNKPDILECYFPSIITACMRAAYDQLKPDGVEAALVPSNNKVKEGTRTFFRKEARYQSMIAGVRKKILRSPDMADFQTDVVYKNEIAEGRFKIRRGSNPGVEHDIITEEEKRGPIAGYYSIAWKTNGTVSVEYMTQAQVDYVVANSQSGPVHKTWPTEMGQKTVARRHAKQLPGYTGVDAEAREMFPQFDPAPKDKALPTPARPTREQFRSLEDDSRRIDITDFGPRAEVDEREIEDVDRDHDDAPKQAKHAAVQDHQDDDAGTDDADAQGEQVRDDAQEKRSIPATEEDWQLWLAAVRTMADAAKASEDIDRLWEREALLIDAAPGPIAEEVNTYLSDRLADLASGGSQAGAGPAGDDHGQSGKEDHQ